MNLSDVREWLKTMDTGAEHFYIGRISSEEKAVCVYQLAGGSSKICYGGLSQNAYKAKRVTLLLRWSNNADEAEKAAQSIYDSLQSVSRPKIGGKQVYMITMLVPEPVDVTGAGEIYERVIDFEIIYER